MKKILSPFLELDLTDFVFVFAFVGTVSVFRAFIRYLTIAAQRRMTVSILEMPLILLIHYL